MRRRFGLGVAAGVLAVGLLVVPVVPAAAETYQVVCRAGGLGAASQRVLVITGEGPSEPVVAGEPFVLSNLTVNWTSGVSFPVPLTPEQWSQAMDSATLTLLGQQVVFPAWVPDVESDDPFQSSGPIVWGPIDAELIAPDDVVGEVGLVPEQWMQPWSSLVDPTAVCTGFDESRPFAFVDVVAAPEVPNGGNGPGEDPGVDGDDDGDGDGDGPGRVVRQEVRRVQVPEAAHAAPSFTG